MWEIKSGKLKVLYIIITMIIIVGCAFLVGAFYWYHSRIYSKILEKDMKQINKVSDYVANGVYTELTHGIHVLDNLNESLNLGEILSVDEVKDFLNKSTQNENFSYISIAYFEEFNPDEAHPEIKNKEFAETIKNGDNYISNIQVDGNKDKSEIILAVPFYLKGQIVGAVWGKYPVSELSHQVNLDKTTYRYFHIIDEKGNYITRSANQYVLSDDLPLWEELERYKFLSNTTAEEVRENVEKGKGGNFWFQLDNQARYVSYKPLGIADWYIFSVLSEDELIDYVQSIEKTSMTLLACIVIFIVILISVVSIAVYNIYQDIRLKNKELKIKNQIFSVVQNETNAIIFVYNKANKVITIFYNDKDNTKEETYIDMFNPRNMLKYDQLKQEDYEKYQKLYEDIVAGRRHEPLEIQIKIMDSWEWRRIYTWESSEGNTIGFVEDFSEYQEEIDYMKQKATRDILTGLYNRGGFEQEVNQYLKKGIEIGNIRALFYLDLDQFKEVNDQFGHAMGDKVLCETAITLTSVIGTNDLACRLGGDEFALFISNIRNIHEVQQIGQKLVDSLEKSYEKDGIKVTISASVGIAIVKENMTLQELYETADKALYEVKREQKNGYRIAQE